MISLIQHGFSKKMIEQYLKAELECIRSGNFHKIGEYYNIHDYIGKHGIFFRSNSLTLEEKDFLAQFKRYEFLMKQCYRNAQNVAIDLQSTKEFGNCPNMEVKYIEGLAHGSVGFPVDHAWVSLNGKVIDYTWGESTFIKPKNGRSYIRRKSRILGEFPEDWEYCGVEVDIDQMAKEIVKHKTHISVLDDYQCKWPILRSEVNV